MTETIDRSIKARTRESADWQMISLRRLFRIVGGATPKSDVAEYWDGDVQWVTPADLGKTTSLGVHSSARTLTGRGLDSCAAELLPPGSIIVSVRAPIGTIGIAEAPLATNQGCKGLVGSSVDPVFMAYQLSVSTKSLEAIGRGTTFTEVSATDLGSFKVVVPPRDLQEAIVTFLDRETARIDALISKQKQLITTLREDRTATINRAVTKGLNPRVEMRDSGVRWMGEVPAHWQVDRIKSSVASARNGVWGAEPDVGSEDIRCVRVADFDRPHLTIHDRDVTFRKVTRSEQEGRILQRGDLLLEKSGGGDKNPVGFVVLYDKDEPAVCSNFVARVKLAPRQDPRFWTYVHHCLYQSRLTYPSIKQNTGIQNLDQQSYFNERVGFPPFEEQSEIAEVLDSHCALIDSLIGKSTEMIGNLGEYRSALIHSAVTGKIDVREAV